MITDEPDPLDGRLQDSHGSVKLLFLFSVGRCFDVATGIFCASRRPAVDEMVLLLIDGMVTLRADCCCVAEDMRSCERSHSTDDLGSGRPDSTGPEAERSHVRLDPGVLSMAGSA